MNDTISSASTAAPPYSRMSLRLCPWLPQVRIVATSRIQPREIGMRIFQPSFISWSYRTRGSEPRSQMKKKMNAQSLIRNHRTGHQPELAPDQTVEIGGGAR